MDSSTLASLDLSRRQDMVGHWAQVQQRRAPGGLGCACHTGTLPHCLFSDKTHCTQLSYTGQQFNATLNCAKMHIVLKCLRVWQTNDAWPRGRFLQNMFAWPSAATWWPSWAPRWPRWPCPWPGAPRSWPSLAICRPYWFAKKSNLYMEAYF